jgi:hypothetical protein
MTKTTIKNSEINELTAGETPDFPKYTTQILNLANQNSQATRPRNVGQMSELIKQFEGKSIDEWENWYIKRHPESLEKARKKVFDMVKKLKKAIDKIDEEMIEKWVEDLVITKTYTGLYFQEAIVKKVAKEKAENFKPSTLQDEAKGIDGFIGNNPISVKPMSYQSKKGLNEEIDVDIIYYAKKKSYIKIEYDF